MSNSPEVSVKECPAPPKVLAPARVSVPVLFPVKERFEEAPLIIALAPKTKVDVLATLMLLLAVTKAIVNAPTPVATPIFIVPPPINEMTSEVPFALVVVLLRVSVLLVIVPDLFASIAIVPAVLKLSVSAV
jgi:hypothetical protein